MKLLLLGILCFLRTANAWAVEDRIWLEAKVNGKPARFAFDTGAPGYVLFHSGAVRLGLTLTNVDSRQSGPTKSPFTSYSEMCSMTLQSQTFQTWFWVLDLPTYLGTSMDGVIGWPCVENCVTVIDAKSLTMQRLWHVPMEDTTNWIKLDIQTNSEFLRLIVPQPGGKKAIIAIDTGSPQGVKLNPAKWREWKYSHPKQPITLDAGFMPGAGIVVSEESWAKELSLGPLKLTDVPVTEANSVDVALGTPDYEATLGLAALKRLDLVVDGAQGVAYLRPKTDAPPEYEHNRCGVVFVPRDAQSDDLTAHVVKNGPAYTAGIRDDDVLLKVDDRDVRNWRHNPDPKINTPMSDQPAGSKIQFTLKRGHKTFTTTVVLKDILSP
jgi:hypothetical protein